MAYVSSASGHDKFGMSLDHMKKDFASASALDHDSASASGQTSMCDDANLNRQDYLSIWGDLVRQEFEHANGAYSWKSEDVPNLLDALILQGTCVKAALLQYESEKSDMASLTIVLSQDEALARLLVQGVTLEISLSDPLLNWQTTVEVESCSRLAEKIILKLKCITGKWPEKGSFVRADLSPSWVQRVRMDAALDIFVKGNYDNPCLAVRDLIISDEGTGDERRAQNSHPSSVNIDEESLVLGLNSSQRQAVALYVKRRITCIQGPPGTGKTKVATAIMQTGRLLDSNRPVIGACQSNVAADSLTLATAAKPGCQVVRIGDVRKIKRKEVIPHILDVRVRGEEDAGKPMKKTFRKRRRLGSKKSGRQF